MCELYAMNSHGCRGCCLVSTAPSGSFLSFFLLSSLEEGQMGLFGGICHCWVSILLQLLPSLSSLEPFPLTYLDASVQLNQVLLPLYHLIFSSKAKCFDATVFVTRGNNLVKSIISYHFKMYTNWAFLKKIQWLWRKKCLIESQIVLELKDFSINEMSLLNHPFLQTVLE